MNFPDTDSVTEVIEDSLIDFFFLEAIADRAKQSFLALPSKFLIVLL